MNNSIITIYKKRIDKGDSSVFYETISSLYYNNSVEECLEYLLTKGYIIKSVTIDGVTTNIPLKTDFDFMRNTYSYLFSVDEIELMSLGIRDALNLDYDFEKSIKCIDINSHYMDNNFIDMIDLQSIKHDKLNEMIKIHIDGKDDKLFLYFNDDKEKFELIELHSPILDVILCNNDYLEKYDTNGRVYGKDLSEAIENYCEEILPIAKEFISLLNDTVNKMEDLYNKNYSEEKLSQFVNVKEN